MDDKQDVAAERSSAVREEIPTGKIRGYALQELLKRELTASFYRACTDELWIPPEVCICLLAWPEGEEERARFRERFEHEARSLIRVRHPALVPLYAYGECEQMSYLLFPPFIGETLAERLQQQQQWSLSEACTFLRPLAEALDMLHRENLVYQFLRPEWIFVADQQSPQIAHLRLAQMLTRHGLATPAKGWPEHLLASDQSLLCRSEYVAPELFQGEQALASSDIYTLGVLLYELLSGEVPFRGESPLETARKVLLETPHSLHERRPDLPVALDVVLHRALHHDPAARFASAGEMIAACLSIQEQSAEASSFSLLSFLLVQRETLPPLETVPVQQTLPRAVQQLPLSAGERLEEAQPSSLEEQLEDSWLNTSTGSNPSFIPVEIPQRPVPALPERARKTHLSSLAGQRSAPITETNWPALDMGTFELGAETLENEDGQLAFLSDELELEGLPFFLDTWEKTGTPIAPGSRTSAGLPERLPSEERR